MPTIPQPTLETERLRLRPFQLEDGPTVDRLAGAWEVANTTLTLPHPYPAGGGAMWIGTHGKEWTEGRNAVFAITLRESGGVVGAVGLTITPEHRRAELGYWIGQPYWNRGYATEAARAVVGFGFGSLGLERVHARHFTRNPASGRVLQKVGMRFEGVQRHAFHRFDRFEDAAVHAILRADWPPPEIASDAGRQVAHLVNLADAFSRFSDHWSPRIVGTVNDFHVKLVKLQGEFVWHSHDVEDELFLVLQGALRMQFRDREERVRAGEFLIVPHGVEHRPVADDEVHVLLLEPASTVNTGTAGGERTRAAEWLTATEGDVPPDGA